MYHRSIYMSYNGNLKIYEGFINRNGNANRQGKYYNEMGKVIESGFYFLFTSFNTFLQFSFA